MSVDKMQDVFPIEFDFVDGEQPDAVKLTGWRKQTDAAFSRVVQAIGDPWEYNTHSNGASVAYNLSPSRLAQASLSRMIGPSDYASPQGGPFNEAITGAIRLTLNDSRNAWKIGFPLIKKTSSDITPTSSTDNIVELTWGVGNDIQIVSAPLGEFDIANKKSTPEAVVDSGDWYVDSYAGIIVTFNSMSSEVLIDVTNMNMLGPGVPWGTANIIPSWDQNDSRCTVTLDSGGSPSIYILTFPNVTTGTRTSGELATESSSWDATTPGQTSSHRLPYSITSNLLVNDEIPEGFMLLWNDSSNRIIPLITFKYRDEYSVTLETPEDWLDEGSDYRLILTGSSLAENVNYLMSVVRDNNHNGLTDGQDQKTIAYTNPIGHDDLAYLYSGSINPAQTDVEKYLYTKSVYPVNPHSQYLHRAGYMENDTGNSANAMRGHLVLAGEYDSTSEEFPIGSGTAGGIGTRTYGISFGGYDDDDTSGTPRIYWDGGINLTAATSGSANRLGFGLDGVGLNSNDYVGDFYGALAVAQYDGMPLYLKGSDFGNGTGASANHNSGGSLGFDYAYGNEMNFVKVHSGYRTGITNSASAFVAANTGQASFASPLDITSIDNRISHQQVREFRFRACSYVPNATDTTGSIGDQNTESEFDYYFSSPAIVGADWLNVYSNAIFFAETADGKATSFTERAFDWLSGGAPTTPVGMYYVPTNGSTPGYFRFVAPNATASTTTSALNLSAYGTTTMIGEDIHIGDPADTDELLFRANNRIGIGTSGCDEIDIVAGNTINVGSQTSTNIINLRAEDDINIGNSSDDADINISTTNNINLYGNNEVRVGNPDTDAIQIQALADAVNIDPGGIYAAARDKIVFSTEDDSDLYQNLSISTEDDGSFRYTKFIIGQSDPLAGTYLQPLPVENPTNLSGLIVSGLVFADENDRINDGGNISYGLRIVFETV